MNNNKDYLEKDIKKHQPKLFIPIFNTILGIGFIALMIRVTIYNDINPWYLVLVIFFMLIFIVGSWFTSFFYKKKNKELTKDFENETALLFEAIYELKQGTYIEPKTPVKFDIEDEYSDIPYIEYDKVKRTFLPKDPFEIFINCGTNCCGLSIDDETLKAIRFQGMSPYSLWENKKLVLPEAKKGSLKLNMDGYKKVKKLTLKILNATDTYYNKKSGIFALGDLHRTSLDDNIQIGENIIVSLYENEIQCIYVMLKPNLFHK